MARPLRILAPGAFYHVMSRGNARMTIYCDDQDRRRFLQILDRVVQQFRLSCHAYCLMSNHYHMVIETRDANLSQAVRQLNGVYAQWWNRRHGRVGHVLQGRFKAQLVQRERYFLEVCRYVVLNPVRAGLVNRPGEWPWSSYACTEGTQSCPSFLTIDLVRSHFDGAPATAGYRRFIDAGLEGSSIATAVRQDARVIGDQAFAEQFKIQIESAHRTEVPSRERNVPQVALSEVFASITDRQLRDRRIWEARVCHGYRLIEIAAYLGIHYSTVSKIVAKMNSGQRDPRSRFKT